MTKWCTKRAHWLGRDAFPSANALLRNLDIAAGLQSSWKTASNPLLGEPCIEQNFYLRNSLEVMKDILRDPSLREDFVWAPRKLYDTDGNRLYMDMWTGDWWWEMQERLHPDGRIPETGSATVIPIILSSDKTLFGSMSGTQIAWPVYMTVGNVPMKKRWLPSKTNARCIGLLPSHLGSPNLKSLY
jgi:hypothetical protein